MILTIEHVSLWIFLLDIPALGHISLDGADLAVLMLVATTEVKNQRLRLCCS
jgi:hypothetical protein